MTTINLKDFYYWYLTDELVEVPDEVAEELMASKRREAAHAERVRYNKAYYSLDCDDGTTGRHWLAMAGAAAGFVCIWALRPVRAQQPPRKN